MSSSVQLLAMCAILGLGWIVAMALMVGWILYRKFGTRAARCLTPSPIPHRHNLF